VRAPSSQISPAVPTWMRAIGPRVSGASVIGGQS
jgi:hypothetical protein